MANIIDTTYFEHGNLFIPNNKDLSVEPVGSPTVITNLDSFIDDGKNIIIPFGIDESKECFERGIKNTLVMPNEIYDMLDNKATCFTFAELINVHSVDTFLTEPNQNILKDLTKFIYKHSNYELFLIKPRYSLDSRNIQILNKIDLLKKEKLSLQSTLKTSSRSNCRFSFKKSFNRAQSKPSLRPTLMK